MSNSAIRNQKAKLAADYNELLKELTSSKLKSIGCYDIGETIGRGSYGKVKLGLHKLTCRAVAIKQINKKHAHLMAREIHHQRQLNHPNIVSLYEILSTETSIFIVSEHCPHGDLFDALTRQGRFSESVTRIWFKQLMSAIEYCHQLGIIHRDLKLENILLDENDNVKICDFGFARQTDKNQLLKTFCGSLAYSAPEVIQRQAYFGPATDIWSLGVILYSLLAGELPFDDDCESVLQNKIITLDYSIPSYFSEDATDLLASILRLKPNERAKSSQIIHHPWLSQQTQNCMLNPISTASSQQEESKIIHHLLNAGLDTTTVKEMQTNHVGMLPTLWSMLVKKSKEDNKEESWMSSFKSWFISKPPVLKTELAPPIITTAPPLIEEDPAYKELNTSSILTISSSTTAEDDEEDEHSVCSSPATSFEEEEKTQPIVEPYNMTAFHRVSPMPSRADILIPRSRYNNNTMHFRNRLENNKMIIEEEEEEECIP